MNYSVKSYDSEKMSFDTFLEAIECAKRMHGNSHRNIKLYSQEYVIEIDDILREGETEFRKNPEKSFIVKTNYAKYIKASSEEEAVKKAYESLDTLEGLGDGWVWCEDVESNGEMV